MQSVSNLTVESKDDLNFYFIEHVGGSTGQPTVLNTFTIARGCSAMVANVIVEQG